VRILFYIYDYDDDSGGSGGGKPLVQRAVPGGGGQKVKRINFPGETFSYYKTGKRPTGNKT